jgi:hypothetical protein
VGHFESVDSVRQDARNACAWVQLFRYPPPSLTDRNSLQLHICLHSTHRWAVFRTMAGAVPSPGNSQMGQLSHARNLALADPAMYSKVLPVILPILHAHNNPSPDVREWGAAFLAETFSSAVLSSEVKQVFSVQALPLLMEFLQLPPGVQTTPVEQTGMAKSAIQTAASVYPLVFRHM